MALTPWLPFFGYINMTKKQGILLKWPDLVGAFLKFIAPHMEYCGGKGYEGYDVYISLKSLNFERKNVKNKKPNYILMKDGKNPYGSDGFIMEWHHFTRIDVHSHDIKIDQTTKDNHEGPYILILIPNFLHKEYDALLHPSNYVAPRNEINRTAFGTSRAVINQRVENKYYQEK